MTEIKFEKPASPYWMQYGSTHYEIGSADPGKITVEEVAHALAHLNRYTGHARTPISVAQHSVFVSKLLDLDTRTALYGLLHDVHETVVSDVNWPMKKSMPPAVRDWYEHIAERADEALFKVFGVEWPVPPDIAALIKKADWVASATEKRDVMRSCDREWEMLPCGPHHTVITPVPARAAREMFLTRYRELIAMNFKGKAMSKLTRQDIVEDGD